MTKQEFKDLVNDLVTTRDKLRDAYLKEKDPRIKIDIAETLDRLEPIITKEIYKLLDKVV